MEKIEFVQTNWLTASAITGLLRVLNYAQIPYEELLKGKKIEIPIEVWKKLPELFADYLWYLKHPKNIFSDINKFYNNSSLAQIKKHWDDVIFHYGKADPNLWEVRKYFQTFLNEKKFNKLKKDFFEFDPKLVDIEFITFAVRDEVLNLLEEFEKELSTAKGKKLKELKEQIRENELIKELNRKGKESNERVIKPAIVDRLKDLLTIEVKEENLPTCRFCFKRKAYKTKDGTVNTLEEKHFTPLFASSRTLENFFYNGINSLFLCNYCEFLLYFAMFGFQKAPNGNYYFVYIPSDIETTFQINELLREKQNVNTDFIKESLVEVAKFLAGEKVEWFLSNVFFVEIEPISQNTANVYTFHIPLKVAEVIKQTNLTEKFPKALNPIFDIVLYYTFEGISLYNLITQIVANYFYFHFKERKVDIKGNSFRERAAKFAKSLKTLPKGLTFLIFFEELLKGGLDMKSLEKQINWAFREGKEVRKLLKQLYPEKYQKRIETVSYRLLDAVRRKDVDGFAQNLIRLYISIERPIPHLFVEALKEEAFNRIVYAFLVGLNNEVTKQGEEEKVSEETTAEV
jgi:CRISPR-associated protein Cas8b1/Cst1 subtype I-B